MAHVPACGKSQLHPMHQSPVAPPSLLPSSRPTDERTCHVEAIDLPDVDGTAFRPGWLVQSRLDGLYLGKLIDWATYDAGQALARDFWTAGGTPGSPLAHLGLLSFAVGEDAFANRLDAARRLRAVRDRIGEGAFALVVACCVEDRSWRDIGRQLRCRGTTAKSAVISALERLAGTAR